MKDRQLFLLIANIYIAAGIVATEPISKITGFIGGAIFLTITILIMKNKEWRNKK